MTVTSVPLWYGMLMGEGAVCVGEGGTGTLYTFFFSSAVNLKLLSNEDYFKNLPM